MTAEWTTPRTWEPNYLVSAADLNEQIRDNLEWLKSPVAASVLINEASNYSITHVTTYANIDAINLAITLTPVDDTVLVGFMGTMAGGTNGGYIDVAVDGVRQAGDLGIYRINSGPAPVSLVWRISNLTPNEEVTFSLQWRTAGLNSGDSLTLYAGAGGSQNDVHPQFWVAEVS